jgi:ATP-binding cassette, subfamily B, bacterial
MMDDKRAAPSGGLTLLFTRLGVPQWLSLAAAAALMIVGAIAANYPAVLSGEVVDQVVRSEVTSFAAALPFLAALLLSFLVREIAVAIRKYFVERTGCQLERDELRRLSSYLLRIDLSAFWGQRIGGLNVRIHRSLEGLIKLLKTLFMEFLPAIVISVVALVMAGQRSFLVVLVILGIFAAAMILTVIQVSTQKGIRIALFGAKEEVSANLTEILFGLDYVRVAGGLGQEEARTAELSERMRSKEFLHHRWMIAFDGCKQFLEGLGLVLVVGIGAWQVAQGTLSSGDVLTLALLYGAVAAPLRDLHRIIDEGFESLLKVRELAGLYSLLSDAGIPGKQAPLGNDPIVESHRARFVVNADDGGEKALLSDVSVRIAPGEWVGIAGSSGCGKSTLLKLILGISPRYGGSLKVFGVEARDIIKSDYWRRVGYVGQAPHVIKGTLRDNLVYGAVASNASDDALLRALASAGLSERFSGRGAECLNDPVEEQGRNLSGGERQRLAIARLFLRAPELIILDEATSALDYENEWRLIQELRAQFRNATAIVVAHRLEALRETDRILVMRHGAIVSEGPFEQLSASDPEFKRITNLAEAAA